MKCLRHANVEQCMNCNAIRETCGTKLILVCFGGRLCNISTFDVYSQVFGAIEEYPSTFEILTCCHVQWYKVKIGTVSVHVSALSVDMFSLFQIFFFVIVVEVLFQRVRLEHECLITVSKHEKGGEAPSDSLLSRVFRYRDQTRRTSVEIVPQTKAINNCCVPFLRTIHDCKPIQCLYLVRSVHVSEHKSL